MNLAIRIGEDALTLSLSGRLDAVAADALRPAVERLVADAPQAVVLDLRGVGFLDGAGLGALAFLAKRLGRRLTLAGAQGQPLELLRHLGLARVFGLPAARAARRHQPLAALAWGTPAH